MENIPWITGKGNIVVDLAGSGDGPASFSSTENDDVDRSQEVTIKTTRGGNVDVVRTVRQAGMREYLYDSLGEIMKDSDDVELKVLKENGQFNLYDNEDQRSSEEG